MTENEDNIKTSNGGFVSTKFGKVFLTILSMILVFAGPTYVIYGLATIMNVNLPASFAAGFVLFAIGLVLMRYLVQKKVIA
jgi:lysozyme family protein